jgi:hypothetical protein
MGVYKEGWPDESLRYSYGLFTARQYNNNNEQKKKKTKQLPTSKELKRTCPHEAPTVTDLHHQLTVAITTKSFFFCSSQIIN